MLGSHSPALGIVEIDHGGDSIHAQAVDVILLQPEQRIPMRKSLRPEKLKMSVPHRGALQGTVGARKEQYRQSKQGHARLWEMAGTPSMMTPTSD